MQTFRSLFTAFKTYTIYLLFHQEQETWKLNTIFIYREKVCWKTQFKSVLVMYNPYPAETENDHPLPYPCSLTVGFQTSSSHVDIRK